MTFSVFLKKDADSERNFSSPERNFSPPLTQNYILVQDKIHNSK